jgi:hypothetical protein
VKPKGWYKGLPNGLRITKPPGLAKDEIGRSAAASPPLENPQMATGCRLFQRIKIANPAARRAIGLTELFPEPIAKMTYSLMILRSAGFR